MIISARGYTSVLLALSAASLLWSQSAQAQASAAINAVAEVSDLALSVLEVQDLAFGDVTPGLSTTIDARSATNAGEFEIRGAKGAEITADLTLPTTLNVGALSMPITFSGSSGCTHNRDQQPQCTYFDPSATLVTKIRNRNFPDNLRMIWIGGTASPGATQFPGVYRGTVTLTVAYTGN